MEKPYYHSQESVEEYIRLAKDVDGSAHIAELIPYLTNGAKVLELGTGPGKDWNLLSEHYTVVGSDYSKEFLERLKSKSPEGRFLHLDAVTLLVDDSFDGIYSNKVLHHLTDEQLQSSIRRQHDLLASGGIICHTFWVGEGTEEFKGMYVNYQSAESLRGFFESHFDLLLLEPYAEFEKDDSLLLIAAAQPK